MVHQNEVKYTIQYVRDTYVVEVLLGISRYHNLTADFLVL